MGARAVSPGGALLRSSRLFSLPRAIPDKQIPFEQRMENPESSTKPHPTHQTITSPQTSREKGDWGLKRPLPLKQTMATTTPLLKVRQLDSVEKITDYGSSSDHALTLEKFQEMQMSITVPRPDHSGSDVRMSAFEKEYDFTVPPANDQNRKGWKFSGPWLASLAEGRFEEFINKKVMPRRAEFRKLIRHNIAYEKTLQNNKEALEGGQQRPEPVLPETVTDEDLRDYMRHLRSNRDKLYALVTNFLGLPPLQVPVGFNEAMGLEPTNPGGLPNMRFDASGPPPSHPSAGLGYLRTHSFMENHFLYGPQAQKKPVLARLLQPMYSRKPPMLGVGGFVTEAPYTWDDGKNRSFKGRRSTTSRKGVSHLDIQTHGGAKGWVVPEKAYIDPNGKVVLKVADANDETRLIAMEKQGHPTVYNDSRSDMNLEESEMEAARYDRAAEILVEEPPGEASEEGTDVMGSASAYGMDAPEPESAPEPARESETEPRNPLF